MDLKKFKPPRLEIVRYQVAKKPLKDSANLGSIRLKYLKTDFFKYEFATLQLAKSFEELIKKYGFDSLHQLSSCYGADKGKSMDYLRKRVFSGKLGQLEIEEIFSYIEKGI